MADKRLVVTDVDPNSPEFGAMLALAPGQATALPIPAFRTGASTPPTGTVVGEGFINTSSHSAMVWDGTQWSPIVQGALVVYATDADVIADTNAPVGQYATSQASGNLFVKGPTWRQIGVRIYTTVAQLLADTTAPEGSLGVAEDEETFWVMHQNAWHCHSRRPVADVAGLAAWANPPEGSTALEAAEELRYHYHSGHWIPESIWIKTEADILASTDRLEGQMAVASDTGHVYVFHSGNWMSSQVQHYATEAALLADNAADGVLAWGDDTGLVYARSGGSWRRVNSPTIAVGATAPATPAAGDIHLDDTNGATTIYDGTKWVNISGTPPPVGEIIMYPSMTPPAGYLLCDGRAVDQNTYPQLYALVGGNLPDLRDQFVRGATSSSDCKGRIKHQDTTRGPRNPFVGTTDTEPAHNHTGYYKDPAQSGGPDKGIGSGTGWFGWGSTATTASGAHSHSVNITGGGDSETAPKHVRLAYMIRHD